MLTFIADYYYKAGQPLLAALSTAPYSTKELAALYRAVPPRRLTRFENVIAWLESYGHISYKNGSWHANPRLNLAALANGIAADYGVTLEELRSNRPFGRHVTARSALSWYAHSHGYSYGEIGLFLKKQPAFIKNSAERYQASLEAA